MGILIRAFLSLPAAYISLLAQQYCRANVASHFRPYQIYLYYNLLLAAAEMRPSARIWLLILVKWKSMLILTL
jgi:hypothetical protein